MDSCGTCYQNQCGPYGMIFYFSIFPFNVFLLYIYRSHLKHTTKSPILMHFQNMVCYRLLPQNPEQDMVRCMEWVGIIAWRNISIFLPMQHGPMIIAKHCESWMSSPEFISTLTDRYKQCLEYLPHVASMFRDGLCTIHPGAYAHVLDIAKK
jgi:hypothetical protein